MQLARYRRTNGSVGVGLVEGPRLQPLRLNEALPGLAAILESASPADAVNELVDRAASGLALTKVELLAPIDRQEVWAAGVTYRRSQVARMEESETSASVYDRVYTADRPELFFKATPHRVVGPGGAVRIRRDAQWNVPEPELALVLGSRLQLVGYTVGNDMSSRDIEGENPLYLPQAKLYDACCGLGPWITLAADMPAPAEIGIRLNIVRAGESVFADATSVGQMARTFADLIGWLGRDNSFPQGAFLLTGTGIVPSSEFTLVAGDRIEIAIDGIGTLVNSVVQG